MRAFLLDAPNAPARRVQIARLRPVSDERYGDFEISRANAENWRRNLSKSHSGLGRVGT
jgi:hypothetical protein